MTADLGYIADAHEYARRIKNTAKRAYARALIEWCLGGKRGEVPGRGTLSIMGAQSVQITLRALLDSSAIPITPDED